MISNIREMQKRIHALNHRWWHDEAGNRLDRNKGELICLFHSEVSEATEGALANAMDDKLPHRQMHEVEMADTAIRILDYAEGFGYDLEPAVITVMEGVRNLFEDDGPRVIQLAQHAVIHLHLSKAMECERKGRTAEVAGWLNGALHLIGLYSFAHCLDLAGAIEEKLAYNAKRQDHTYEARAQANGKKW
ncbi:MULTISPECIES: hypothetical protein [unclassified Agrobacterium]